MPINANYEYMNAEGKFLAAKTDEEKLACLEEMMRTMPKHKGAETLRKNLKTRYSKIKQNLEQERKKKKSSSKKLGIRKEEMQAAIIGLTNSGKSSLLACLTNANPNIAQYEYTTKYPLVGIMEYGGAKIQLIDLPAIENELCEIGTINTADTLLIIITNLNQLENILPFLGRASKTRIIIMNKIDLLTENERRKVFATLQSKKYNFVLVSCKTKENIESLKEKIFQSFGKIRVYTKEPGKGADRNEPLILSKGSTVKNAAEKILHGLSLKIKETRVTGPSSKFPNQKVGLEHVLKDKDSIEFHVK